MSEEYETFREVSLAVGSVHRTINIYAGIFACVVAVALGGYALIFSKIDLLEVSTAKIEERLTSIDSRLAELAPNLAQIAKDTSNIVATVATLPKAADGQKELVGAPLELFMKFKSAGIYPALPRDDKELTQLKESISRLTPEQVTQIKAGCSEAVRLPDGYTTDLIGVCGAILLL